MTGAQENVRLAGVFTKAQLLASSRYTAMEKDMLHAMLAPDKTYSHNQIATMMNDFMNREAR